MKWSPPIFISLVVSCLLFPILTSAQGGLRLSPALQQVEIADPNQPEIFTLSITSQFSLPVTLTLEVMPVSGVDLLGNPIIDQAASAAELVNQQVSVDPSTALLLPQETFDIRVTAHGMLLPPGGTYALLVARVEEMSKKTTSSQQATIVPSVATFIAIRNPQGEERKLALGGVNWPQIPVALSLPPAVEVNLQNRGNVHLEPHGLVEIVDIFDRVLSRGQLNHNSLLVLPQRQRVLGVSMQALRPNLPLAVYTLKTSGADELGLAHFAMGKRFVYISPWLLALSILGGIIWLGHKRSVFSRLRRQQKGSKQASPNRTSVSDMLEILRPKK